MTLLTRNTTVPPPPSHNSLVVRSLPAVTVEEREAILRDVEYNIFNFPAGLLTVDFLTDSGTSAMTDVQWAVLMRGDESYGRNWGYFCLIDAFRDIFERGNEQQRTFETIAMGRAGSDFYRSQVLLQHEGGFANGGTHQLTRPNFFIVPQGRCAEMLLFSSMRAMIDARASSASSNGTSSHEQKQIIISNGFFDTTAANATVAGFELQVFTQPGLNDPFPEELIEKTNPFKGNLDIAATEAFLNSEKGSQVDMLLLTITNNWAAGQPVSIANIRAASALAKSKGIPLFFDACRFAENAFFIHEFEDGYSAKSIPEIVQEVFSYADGFTISLKKDGLANMGGVLCFRDNGSFATRYEGIGHILKERQLICYGNDAYGGMSGRDLMAATAGIYETTKLSFLRTRVSQVRSFAQKLQANGVPVLLPPGGHAVYLDMVAFFHGCDRRPEDFASIGFTLELIRAHGIRAIESGPFAWEWDKKTPEERAKIPDLVRFAVPRHVLSDQHIDYAVASIADLHRRRHAIPNVEITRGKEMRLRHFTVGMRPLPVSPLIADQTYVGEAVRQLAHLSRALGQRPATTEKLVSALEVAGGEWGRDAIPSTRNPNAWASEACNDHSPFEYSLALDQKTGEAELRFLVEAQPAENNMAELQKASLQLSDEIVQKYSDIVSLDRFHRVRDIFLPESGKAEGILAAWHSFAVSDKGQKWKIYLNPQAEGKQAAAAKAAEAFERLGLGDSWKLLKSVFSEADYVIYFALGLSPNPNDAEAKVYVAHPSASAARIAQLHAAVDPDADTYEIQQFCSAMAGGPRGLGLGPYHGKPLLSCFAFKRKNRSHPRPAARTVLFPLDSYAAHDAEAQDRVERYMDEVDAPKAYRQRYRMAIASVQRRPLEAGRGIHSWASLKVAADGGRKSNCFYLSPEFFGMLGLKDEEGGSGGRSNDINGVNGTNGVKTNAAESNGYH